MTRFLLVCAGGAAGSGARYLLTLWMVRVAGAGFPWGTLLVNVTGSFFLALIVEAWPSLDPDLRLMLTAGVMGGFTTYSAFNYDTLAFVRAEAWMMAAANVLLTLLVCFGAGILGVVVGRAIAS